MLGDKETHLFLCESLTALLLQLVLLGRDALPVLDPSLLLALHLGHHVPQQLQYHR